MIDPIPYIIAILVAASPGGGDYEVAERGDQTQIIAPAPVEVEPVTGPHYGSAISGRCTQFEHLLEFFSPGWDIDQFSRIMWRESRCQPDAANSCCTGLVQIHRLHLPNLAVCGVTSRSDLTDPAKNICSAAVVFRRAGGTSPWAQTR